MSDIEQQIVDKTIKRVQTRMARCNRLENTKRGLLVAEGDSWFNFPGSDILEELEDFGYDVESVAWPGDTMESMAYSDKQLDKLTRCLERLHERKTVPRAILLSGGGNDFTGQNLEALLNHSESGLCTLNQDVVRGVINVRLYAAYMRLIGLISKTCDSFFSQPVPVLIHGYAHAVPDGHGWGWLKGWGPLPGPWLKTAFTNKGYPDLCRNTQTIGSLVDKFNSMLIGIQNRIRRVRYVDVRDCLTNGRDYRSDWQDELHPTEQAFCRIAVKFSETIERGTPQAQHRRGH